MPVLTAPLKFHGNHIVSCGRCDCSLLSFLSHRIVRGQRTVWYRCLNCFHTFRCCARIFPTHLTAVRGQIHKLEKVMSQLVAIDAERFALDIERKAAKLKLKPMEIMLANFVVDRPLIVVDKKKVVLKWSCCYLIL